MSSRYEGNKGMMPIQQMKTQILFISRHAPTNAQIAGLPPGHEVVLAGDCDAYDIDAIKRLLGDKTTVEVAVVNAAMALNIASIYPSAIIWVAENEMRPGEDGKPTFYHKKWHRWVTFTDAAYGVFRDNIHRGWVEELYAQKAEGEKENW